MNKLFATILVIFVSLLLGALPVEAKERHVDCDKGQTIQEAVDKIPTKVGERLELYISGDCEEVITIRRRDVTLDGNDNATIIGAVRVFTASNVWFLNLTITGPGRGLIVSGSNNARLASVNLVENDQEGLYVGRNALVWIRPNTTIANNGSSGVYVENASIDTDGATIVSNTGDGILADNASNVILRNTTISGNTEIGVSANLHSVVDFKGATYVSGNLQLGAFAGSDSALRIYDENVWFDDHIYCGDDESSFENRGGVTNGGVNCSDFN